MLCFSHLGVACPSSPHGAFANSRVVSTWPPRTRSIYSGATNKHAKLGRPLREIVSGALRHLRQAGVLKCEDFVENRAFYCDIPLVVFVTEPVLVVEAVCRDPNFCEGRGQCFGDLLRGVALGGKPELIALTDRERIIRRRETKFHFVKIAAAMPLERRTRTGGRNVACMPPGAGGYQPCCCTARG